jgi:RNA polymerase sigma factor (sigma-70 family)
MVANNWEMSISQPASDAELLAAVPHDAAAFEAFYRRYVRRVTGFAVKRCSSAEDAADVVAHTFVRLIAAARRYDPSRGRPDTFLLGITANVIRDVERRNARHRALLSKLAGRELLEADDLDRIEAAIDAAGTADRVRDALEAVPPGEQEMLRLVATGHTPGQAADQLGISYPAGRARLSRARRRIRRSLTGQSEPMRPSTSNGSRTDSEEEHS